MADNNKIILKAEDLDGYLETQNDFQIESAIVEMGSSGGANKIISYTGRF